MAAMNFVLAAADKMNNTISVAEFNTTQDIQEQEMEFEYTNEEDRKIEEAKTNCFFNSLFSTRAKTAWPIDAEKEEKKRLRREALRRMNGRTRFAEDFQVKIYKIVDGEDKKCRHTEKSTRAKRQERRKTLADRLKQRDQCQEEKEYQERQLEIQENWMQNEAQLRREQFHDALRAGHSYQYMQSIFDQEVAAFNAKYQPKLDQTKKWVKETNKAYNDLCKIVNGMLISQNRLQELSSA